MECTKKEMDVWNILRDAERYRQIKSNPVRYLKGWIADCFSEDEIGKLLDDERGEKG